MSLLPTSQLDYPAQVPPPGVIADFIHPGSAGPILIIVGSILEAFMISFVVNRLLTKAFIVRRFTWDDLTCVVGALLTTAYFGVSVFAVTKCHFGTHQWNLTLGQYVNNTTLITEYVTIILAPPTLLFVKVTFFILFLQLFRPDRKLRLAINVGLIFTMVFYTVIWVLGFVSATRRPGENWLQHETQNPVEQIEVKLAVVIPTIGIAIDLYILAVPLIGIFTLQLPMRQKFGAGLVFFTAIIAVIASVLSLVYRIAIYHNPFDDLTYNQMPVLLTSIVEMSLGVCISCMPTFSRMLRHTLPQFKELRSWMASLSFVSKSRSKGSGASGCHNGEEYDIFVKGNDSDSGLPNHELRQIHPSKTHIRGSVGNHVEEDGIHLKYDLRQESYGVGEGMERSVSKTGDMVQRIETSAITTRAML